MKAPPRPEILRAHDFCYANEAALVESRRAGCFYCLAVFDPQEITDWIPDKTGKTAICPHCGIDSVLPENADFPLPEPLTEKFLREMYDYWFSPIRD